MKYKFPDNNVKIVSIEIRYNGDVLLNFKDDRTNKERDYINQLLITKETAHLYYDDSASANSVFPICKRKYPMY